MVHEYRKTHNDIKQSRATASLISSIILNSFFTKDINRRLVRNKCYSSLCETSTVENKIRLLLDESEERQ